MGGLLTRARHPLRALAMAMAALSLAWGTTSTEGLIAAMTGAVLGVVAGELLARSRLRLVVIVGGFGLLLAATFEIASLSLTTTFLPSLIGPGTAIRAAGVARYGVLALSANAALRAVLVRKPAALALELVFIAAAFATAFAAHRDGVIARPLWLSDWAWQAGIDPAQVFLAIGGASVVILAVLLLAEKRDGLSWSSLVALLALALLAVLCLNVSGLPRASAANDLGLTNEPSDQSPHETPRGNDGGRGPNRVDGGGQNQQDGGGQSGRDGGSEQPSHADGGGQGGKDGGMDGGTPPPQISDGSIGPAPPPQGSDGGQGQGVPPPSERLSEDQGPSNSPAPMAVVILDDDYSPPSQAYYFRQEAWSEYNGKRLVATTRSDVDLDTLADFPTQVTPVRDPPPIAGRTTVKARVALLVEHTHPFALETPLSFSPAPNPNPNRFLRAYRFEAASQKIDFRSLLGRKAGDPRWTDEIRAYYTAGPADPRYAQLARQIVSKLPPRHRDDPFAKALAIKAWLDHELIYSTRHRHAGMDDPTADFLFGNRTGYCVHFAHSATFLWRSLGIPTRIGTGYMSAEDNRRGGSAILIRGGDAHAWPELHLEGLGWIVLDVQAERSLDPPGSATDEDLQRLLGEMAREQPPDPMQPPRDHAPPYAHYGRDIGLGALALILAAALVLYCVKLYRRLCPVFAGAGAMPVVGYRAALDVLAEAGLCREEGECRERFAWRVKDTVPSFGELTRMHLAARLRRPDIDHEHRPELRRDEWRRCLKAVRREIPRATKRWRLLLGLLHPLSFLESR
ncbi:MAG: transglutaminase domain-containing protein [Deltaproteobacteria bacterium]|nr:transglutaminase domain-containing protein [Deltaproteobacteria bacterium]